jgi:hypothetical protein
MTTGLWSCDVDSDGLTAVERLAIKGLYGCLCLLCSSHIDETVVAVVAEFRSAT